MKSFSSLGNFSSMYWLACSANLLLFFSFFILLPILPGYMIKSFEASNVQIGFVMSAYTVGALLIRPISGYLTDICEQKKLYILCYSFFTVLFALYFFEYGLWWLGFLRFLHGVAFGLLTTCAMTLVVELIPPKHMGSGIGLYGMASSLAMALGPFLGLSLVGKYGYDFLFSFALFTISSGFIISIFVKPAFKERNISTATFSLKGMSFPKGKKIFFGIFLALFLYGNLVYFLDLYSKERSFTFNVGFVFSSFALGIIISRFISGRLIDKGKLTLVICIGSALIVIFGLVFISTNFTAIILASSFFIGVAYGLIIPAYQTAFNVMAEHHERGKANAMFFLAFDSGLGISILIAGVIADLSNFTAVYFSSTVFALISLVYFIRYVSPQYNLRVEELKLRDINK